MIKHFAVAANKALFWDFPAVLIGPSGLNRPPHLTAQFIFHPPPVLTPYIFPPVLVTYIFTAVLNTNLV